MPRTEHEDPQRPRRRRRSFCILYPVPRMPDPEWLDVTGGTAPQMYNGAPRCAARMHLTPVPGNPRQRTHDGLYARLAVAELTAEPTAAPAT